MMWQAISTAFLLAFSLVSLSTESMTKRKHGPCPAIASSANFDPSKLTGSWRMNWHTDSNTNVWNCGTYTYQQQEDNPSLPSNKTFLGPNGRKFATSSMLVPHEDYPAGHYIFFAAQGSDYVNTRLQVTFYQSEDFETLMTYHCIQSLTSHLEGGSIMTRHNQMDNTLVKENFVEYLGNHSVALTWYEFPNTGCPEEE